MAAKLQLLSPHPSSPPPLSLCRPCKLQTTTINIVVGRLGHPGSKLHLSSRPTLINYHNNYYDSRCRGNRHPHPHPPHPARVGPKRRLLSSPLVVVRSSFHETLWCSAAADIIGGKLQHPCYSLLMIFLADDDMSVVGGYSQASYYTSLGLFIISVPGLWSLIKRSVKSKIVQKTFTTTTTTTTDGDGKMAAAAPNQVAGEILSFFTRNNFVVLDRGEAITFEGMMVPSRSQAALLTFCTCISLASVALVLTITVPDVGNNWFWLTALSPLAGVYYWTRASRKEQIKVKLLVADNGTLSEIIVRGDDQQVDRMRRELQLTEKGMIYVKGILER